MDKRKKSYTVQYIIIAVLSVVIILMLLYIFMRSQLNSYVSFAPDLAVTDNPLMGYAPNAANKKLCANTRMVYIPITWKEWEPEEGVFDIEGLERKYNISQWKEENKHAVIRFMCDVPDDNTHYDIPKWLLDKTGDGVYYDLELGKGYSPNYSNETFMKYHERAIKALAEYCNKDYFVSFVELGSVGHWGEWHTTDGETNLMPNPEICLKYASVYSDSFNHACLLMRRNYDFAVEGGMGFYNDMIGSRTDTEEWLKWIRNGSTQQTSKDKLILPQINFDKRYPVGGEFTSSIPMSKIVKDDFGTTLALITSSKMTFIGPMTPDLNSETYASANDSVLRRIGYRIYVSSIKTQYNFSDNQIMLNLKFKNAGNAGFYFDWPVTVYVFDKDMNRVYWEGAEVDLRDLNTTDEISANCNVPVNADLMKEFYIGVSITDYEGKDRIRLAIDNDGDEPVFVDNAQIIYHYDKNAK